MIGSRFHRLVVLSETDRKRKHERRWLCRCDCGKLAKAITHELNSGHVKSCGCLRVSGDSNRKHMQCKTRTYRIWYNLKDRCKNPNTQSYKNYGARGISYDPRWEKFENFFADMGHPPDNKHEIDRIDNDGNYEKSNCRWTIRPVNARNKRNNRFVTHKEQTLCLKDWTDKLGIGTSTPYSHSDRFGGTPESYVEEVLNYRFP